jgi:hypothetical protein
VGVLRADPYLGMCVRYFRPFIRRWVGADLCPLKVLTIHLKIKSTVPLFVKCLESLPNLHTLEVPWANMRIMDLLEKALKHIELPQIKTLVIPPARSFLFSDTVTVLRILSAWSGICDTDISSDTILSSLVSNRDSKVKRLVIPLVSWAQSIQ